LILGGIMPLRAYVSATNDAQFSVGAGVAGSYVHALLVEPDDKVVIGGNFGSVAGSRRPNVARLMADGALDPSFDPGAGPNGEVLCAARQRDGKILIGGLFSMVSGVARPRLARLNPDGSVDASFNVGAGPNGEVRAITVQPDGKILVGGFFSSVNRANSRCLARLNADGTHDAGFSFGSGPAGGYVFSVVMQPDGKVLVAGEFTSFSGKPRGSITRLLPDGSPDPSFVGRGVDGWIGCARVQADGRLLLAGDFNTCCGVARPRIARVNADGTLDTTFAPGKGVTGNGFALVHCAAVDPDGGIYLGGLFTHVNGTNRSYLARLQPNGSLDATFNPAVSGPVRFLALSSLGRLVIGGEFARVAGAAANRIGRLGDVSDSESLPSGFSAVCRDETGFYATFRNAHERPVRLQRSADLSQWEDWAVMERGGAARLADRATVDASMRFYRATAE
jgi:uncharacterized delta-60 repeat protein